SNFGPFRTHQWVDWRNRLTSAGGHGDGRATRIVAVEPEAPVEVELCLGPGSHNQTELGAKDGGSSVTGVDRQVAVDSKHKHVPAQPDHGAHFGEPLRLILVIQAHTGLAHGVI